MRSPQGTQQVLQQSFLPLSLHELDLADNNSDKFSPKTGEGLACGAVSYLII